MAEEEESSSGAAEEKKKGGMKGMIIKIIPLLLVGFLVAKMTVLKPPPPTQEQLDAAEKTEMLETWATCAADNQQPFDYAAAAAEIEAKIEEEHTLKETIANGGGVPTAPAEGEGLGLPRGGLGLKALGVARTASGGEGGAVSEMNPVFENDAVTLNLTDGHYVKVRLALQLSVVADVEALEVSNYGSMAQDIVNGRLRTLTVEQLQSGDTITALKYELGNEICREYHGEVSTIYFAEFVTQ